MDRSLFAPLLILGLVALIVAYRFEAYTGSLRFTMDGIAPCDGGGSCFVADCLPTEDPSCDNTPYEKVSLPAYAAPDCLFGNDCAAFSCPVTVDCRVTYCSPDTREEGERCVSPTSL